MPSTEPASPLQELRGRLEEQGCQADARTVATAILAIAHSGRWFKSHQAVIDWIGQLALDVVNESS
jgi:hypothetical protein